MSERFEGAIYILSNKQGFKSEAKVQFSSTDFPETVIDDTTKSRIPQGEKVVDILIKDETLDAFHERETVMQNVASSSPVPQNVLVVNEFVHVN